MATLPGGRVIEEKEHAKESAFVEDMIGQADPPYDNIGQKKQRKR